MEIVKANHQALHHSVRHEVLRELPMRVRLKHVLDRIELLPINHSDIDVEDIERRCRERLERMELTLCLTHLGVPTDVMSGLLRSLLTHT